MPTRLLTPALIAVAAILMLAGSTHAAGTQQPSGLPGDPADAKRPPLQKNQAKAGVRLQKMGAKDVSELSVASFGGDGPSTPILDTFTRPNASNLCTNNPAWVCNDPLGGPWVLSVFSEQAGTPDGVTRVSYRHQNYPGDVELYASIPVKPATGGGVSLVFNVREVPGGNWDAYWLTWNVDVGTDTLRIEKIVNNFSVADVVKIPLEMAAGDRFMARRVGAQLEGWVNQGGAWVKVLEGTDADFVGGKFGLFAVGSVGRLDDLGGGVYHPWVPPPLEQSTGTCGIGVHAYSRSTCRGNGVNTLTGAFTTQVVDLALPGIGVPFSWTRTYSSDGSGESGLGTGWTHNFATRLEEELPLALGADGNSANAAGNEWTDFKLVGDEGQRILYAVQGGSILEPPGAISKASFDGEGVRVTRKDQVVYRYDGDGRLLSIKDRNNQGLEFVYDVGGRLSTIIDSVNRQISVTYTAEGPEAQVRRVTLPDSRFVEYDYHPNGLLKSVLDARGELTQYFYEGEKLTQIVDQRGHQFVKNTYHSVTGRVSEQRDALGKLTTYIGDPETTGVTMKDARLNEWTDIYEGRVVTERRSPGLPPARFDYDADLNVTSITDRRGHTTTMLYDDDGNLLKRTAPEPLSHSEEWTYNNRNDPLTYKDGRGNVTDYGYDGAGNLESVLQPDPDGAGQLVRPETRYERLDPAAPGLVTAIVDPLLKRTEFSYEDGNLSEIRTHLGHRTTMDYSDVSGQLEKRVDPRGNAPGADPLEYTWTFEFNAHDQLHKQTNPLGHVTELRYDRVGNLEKRIDAKAHETTYTYWETNRLKTITAPDPDGLGGPLLAPVTQYEYDDVGNLKTETDAENRVTVHDYNPANRLFQTTRPMGRVWTYFHDANGNVDQVIDANGNNTPTVGDGLTAYGYDELNRLKIINYSDSTPDVTFTYDGNGNRTQMTDGSGIETYTHDTLNNLKTVTRGSTIFTYEYDLASNLKKRTYPDSTIVDATYDDDGRLATIASGGLTTSYGYDAAGNLKTTTLPSANGHVETRQYDNGGRLFDLEHKKGTGTLARFVADLDPVGNPTEIVRTGSHALTQTYSYDDLDRLTGVCFQAGTCPGAGDPFIRWTYDRVGNRLTETKPAGTTTYAYNDADELTGRSGLGGPVTYTYDKNGNQTAEGAKTFAYDLAGRMTSATSGSGNATYTYDGVGKRLRVIEDVPPVAPTVRTPCPTAIGTSNTATVAKPAGTVAGDLLIVGLAFEKGSDAQTPTPAGWTLIRRTTQSSNVGYATFRKTAGASEPASYSFTLTNSPKWSIGACAIAGANASAPIVNDLSGSSGNPVAPSIDTGGPNRLVLAFYANKKPTTFNNYTTPPPVSERWDRPNSSGGLPSNAMISYTPAAGPTGTKTAIPGEAAEWVAQHIAIAPGISTSTTKYLWDSNHSIPQVALERDAADVVQRRYLYGHQRIAQTAGTLSYYHADTLGSVAHLTSDTGTTQRTLAYEPFGLTRTNTGPGPGTAFKFTGEYQDGTDLYHLRARQYDSETGRFLSRDPVAGLGSAYPYAANNPLAYTDPLGLWPSWLGTAGHIGLDAVGLIPIIGEPADLINCAWYAAEGEYLDAGLTCGAAVPILGWGAVAAKWGRKGVAAVKAAEDGTSAARLPGTHGVRVPGRLSPAEMAALSERHGVEFALVYRAGPGRSGGGGSYWLHSGGPADVWVPTGPDVRLIYHTHPRGTPFASDADMGVLAGLSGRGSPQLSSQIVLPSGETVRFGGAWTRSGVCRP